MIIFSKIIGRDRVRLSRFHDEKGNAVPPRRIHEILYSAALRASQQLVGFPNLPWVPFGVISIFKKFLNSESNVLEFGSGRSTIWYARHAKYVHSFETNEDWYRKVLGFLEKNHITNAKVIYAEPPNCWDTSQFPDENFDLIIVDGDFDRAISVRNAIEKLKPGGLIYLDNSDKDMTRTGATNMRSAEAEMLTAAARWKSRPVYFTGFAPGNLSPQQGMLVYRRSS